MIKKILITLLIFSLLNCSESQPKENIENETNQLEENIIMEKSIYNLSYNSPSGDEISMENHEGKVLLIVNTATQCGLTPQFEGLEKLHTTYSEKGLKVLGFPCNQFGGQEPLTNEEMVETCKLNHGVTFELAKKIEVNGNDQHELYSYLKSEQSIDDGNEIRWNFEKFLVNREGKVVKRFAPQMTPAEITSEIEKWL